MTRFTIFNHPAFFLIFNIQFAIPTSSLLLLFFSRKGVIKSSKMEVVVQDGSHDVKKKVVIASTLVTQ